MSRLGQDLVEPFQAYLGTPRSPSVPIMSLPASGVTKTEGAGNKIYSSSPVSNVFTYRHWSPSSLGACSIGP